MSRQQFQLRHAMKRKTKPLRIQRILVPTDFSAHSEHALDYAFTLAKQLGARILLMHVIDSLSYSVTDTFIVIEHRRALETTARSLLDNFRQDLVERGLAVTVHLVTGAPYDQILKKSRQEKVDLIVMGTHGRTGVKHLLLGSVAEKVVRLSTCPVLTVPISPERRATTPAKSARKSAVTLY
jgi:nucleotide-binding universal stress UspA family protein